VPDSSAVPVTVTSGAGGKGSWTQLIASTTEDYKALIVSLGTASGNGVLVDIGFGGAGAETPVVKNLMHIGRNTDFTQGLAVIPLVVPVGTRIAARASASVAIPMLVTVSCLKDAFVTFDGMDSSITADTSYYGTTIPTGTNPTPGSWVQLVASAAQDYDAVIPMWSNAGLFASSTRRHWFDIAIGAAASEVPFALNIGMGDDGTSDITKPMLGPVIRKHIPTGSRIAVRGQTTTAGNSTVSMGLGLFRGMKFAGLAGPLVL
jgi:hypothetical protein